MHKLYDLREMLCDELEEYGNKDHLDANSLQMIDTLAHAVKNIDKIIEGGYSGDYSKDYSRDYNRDDDRSYARKRDSMGRYSRMNSFRSEMEDLMSNAPNEQIKQRMQGILRDI